MLSLHPQGATGDQIIWRLRSSGIRIDASELLHGLTSLSDRGEIVRDTRGRWKLTEFTKPVRKPTAENPEPKKPLESSKIDALYAVDARCGPLSPKDLPETSEQKELDLPEWSQLLDYYAATQRHDPRGQIEEFKERHGQNWHLFRTSGRWWSGSEIRIRIESLPEAFREGLTRRKTSAAALGWPVCVFHGSSGASFVPGLIIPTDWRLESEELVFEVETSMPALNPVWMRSVRAHTGWSEAALYDRLFPEEEDLDVAAIGERMKHALATLGAVALRPGELSGEVSVLGNGIRNAAGIFLPDDGSFTKGAAEDLETLRSWDSNKRAPTSLSALFEGLDIKNKNLGPEEEPVPLISPNALTPSQRQSAERSLAGPVTVIQGPPGTGKSQVILSILISAAVSGRSVLFAAKNHQAVNEVENRLKDLIGDVPLLIRARDADGERDVNFLDALGDIAKGESWNESIEADPMSELQNLLKDAKEQAILSRSNTGLNKLHVEACDLAERLDLFRNNDAKKVRDGANSLRALARLWKWLLGCFSSNLSVENTLPENATERQVERHLAAIKLEIATISATSKKHSIAHELSIDLRDILPKIARRITIPNEADRQFAAVRLKEVEFEKSKSARRMRVEDAMLVLRYRPIWAISTLSVPSRIPLLPCMFDYVVFDEASQCDVASALPLMARASKAIIVGDPMQLRFIPSLGNAAEHALMDAAGLARKGRATIAQSVNSLFDFTERCPMSQRMFLSDQFRSAPAIVDYLNADFYGGRLVNRKEDTDFTPPADYKPGLTWEDTPGIVTLRDGGNVNKAEAERIAALILRLTRDEAFKGSVGVISPFNSQVAEIQSAIAASVADKDCERLNLRVATVDKWQGAEADVIFFSLVIAPGTRMSAQTFLQRERRRLNVAISRARAVCVIVGDLSYARSCGIRHIEYLAKRATTPWSPPKIGLFDSAWERRLDTAMRIRGLNPIPQHPVGTRYLDFALEGNGRKIDIEVDGRRWHTDASGNRKVADIIRDREMQARGWRVLRFWVHELSNDMEECLDRIERELTEG